MAATAPSGRPTLNAGFATLAITLQEAAAAELSNGDVCRRLSDALRDCFRGTGDWAYYIDHFGDAESGDVIYSCSGDTKRAPYSIGEVNGKTACSVQTDAAIDVMPRTVYEEEVADEDHYTAMEAAKYYTSRTEFPLYERFIGKDERKAAPAGSFAGKGKSFPILKPADVMAAVRSMGRAGAENFDAGTLKRNIIRIAKAKGWEKELPKAWQGGDGGKESAVSQSSGLRLVESAATLDPIVLREARADYEIKLIAPGKGSSAIYPAEVLKRDGPKVFKAGTHVYLNHQTAAEEAARPEGDVSNLAGVLTSTAEYRETHAKGPGLYARMKVFADHATVVEEKAPHVGMSIRASGVAEAAAKAGELPTLKELTSAQSVDVVTKAGAGGMILTEAAVPPANPNQEASDMDAAELTKLQESVATQTALNARLLERAIRADARELATKLLQTSTLIEAAKQRVIEAVTADYAKLPVTEGALDAVKFTQAVTEAAKVEGAYVAQVTGSGRVVGMGAAAPVVEIDANEAARKKVAGEQRLKESIRSFRDMGMPQAAAERAARFGEVA